MGAIVRVLDNTPHSDGTIETELSVSVAGGYNDRFTRARVETKAKNRALLHNGYDKAWRRDDAGTVSIDVKEVKETEGRFAYRTFYVVTEIEGATEYLQS